MNIKQLITMLKKENQNKEVLIQGIDGNENIKEVWVNADEVLLIRED